jgi:hypothetical protein
VVDDDPMLHPNFSIVGAAGATTPGARSLYLLYRSHRIVARSRAPRRVVEALLSYLASMVNETSDELWAATSLGIARGGTAALVPRDLLAWIDRLQNRLHRSGLQIVDTPISFIDLERRQLVVPPPTLSCDAAVLEELPAVAEGREAPVVPPGRYDLRSWAFFLGRDRAGPLSRAAAVAVTGSVLDVTARGTRRTMELLGDLFSTVGASAIWYDHPDEIGQVVESLLPRRDEGPALRAGPS